MDQTEFGTFIVSVGCMAASLLVTIALTGSQPVSAADSSADENLAQWQLRRLNNPTVLERQHEREGKVYIYDGLTDRDVDQALSAHFDRIENMMFLGTRKTGSTDAANGTLRPVQKKAQCRMRGRTMPKRSRLGACRKAQPGCGNGNVLAPFVAPPGTDHD